MLPTLLEGDVPTTTEAAVDQLAAVATRSRRRGRVEQSTPSSIPVGARLSGTTGPAQAIVRATADLIAQAQRRRMHLDLRAGRPQFLVTTTGAMMWNFLVRCLAQRERRPSCSRRQSAHRTSAPCGSLAERAGITCMGVSRACCRAPEKAGVRGDRLSTCKRCSAYRLDRIAARTEDLPLV